MIATPHCLICGTHCTFLFRAEVLGKHSVSYFECASCGFIQTEKPYWLEEAYGTAISTLDVGLVSRNISLSKTVASMIQSNFDIRGRFLDYAGGYGLFVRLMRDSGFDFYREDCHCENLFAKNLDLKDLPPGSRFELVTAFEVFEHLANPLLEIEKMFIFSDSVLFSTELIPGKIQSAKDWWYFVPETGQHISFFTMSSLESLAASLKCRLYSDGTSLHILTRRELTHPFRPKPLQLIQSILSRGLRKWKQVAPAGSTLESLIPKDFEAAKAAAAKLHLHHDRERLS